ncbi:MAG: VOC family protein, partial [Nitrososphaerota archaeon]|nr:VOC family protein [Nitrososphaerota archaeon]
EKGWIKKSESIEDLAILISVPPSTLELTYWHDKKDWIDGDQLDHIALVVKDVPSTVEELRTKGVEIAKEPYSLKGSTKKIAFIKDPNGIWIELVTDA